MIEISGTKENTLLAALLLARGKVISDERLTELLWGWDPPRTVSAQIYTYISRLRKRLGPDVEFIRRQPGYVLEAPGSRIDIADFERLGRLGTAALQDGHPALAAQMLRRALGLWSGDALANVTPQLAQAYVPPLEETWATLLEQRIEADLKLGLHQELIAELTGLVAEFPVRERLRALLMTALYRCNRQADALHVFHAGRQVLSEELGIDPSPMLVDTYQAILDGELPLGAHAQEEAEPVSAHPAGHVARPITLPPDLVDFVGREQEFKRLCELLRPDPPAGPHDGSRRFLITGMGGVGKTALALHATHEVRKYFPDGQFYVNLCHPDGEPRDPRDLLSTLLRAFGENPGECRDDLDELVRMYRIATYDKRIVLILDDAVGDLQLEPLLPSTARPTVLITGRTRVAAVSETNTLVLRPMQDGDALALLSAVAGAERMSQSPDEARDIVTHCAGLPLALRIAGARWAARSHPSAARLTQRLGNPGVRLSELCLGDLDVRRNLLVSVRRLAPESQVFLRRLARVTRGTFSSLEISVALAMPPELAELLLEVLVDKALVEVTEVDDDERLHYRLHDLVRLLATDPDSRPRPADRTYVPPQRFRDWADRSLAKIAVISPAPLGHPSRA
ncbi:BTAD domain-containing putative transcriptional regulator [Kitasatospora sp. NPDC058170]|uniref:AfsR/SARP family transcriptional regulator n=1 Tax=Kitasatospora sp. NPDC058170 TaxID=3346364 RepID=UPI0036D83EDB